MAPITRRWLVLAGSLAPVSLAAAQIIVTERHEHMASFQSAVLWDVNNDGKKELVIGGGGSGNSVYDPDHISDGPLAMNFNFPNGARGLAATPSGFLYGVGDGGGIAKYNSFTTAGANVDNGTATGLAFFEGTPWGDVAIVSGLRNNVPYLVAEFFGGMNHNAELFAIPIVVEGDRILPQDLFGSKDGDQYIIEMATGNEVRRVALGSNLSAPVLQQRWMYSFAGIGLTGGGASGFLRVDNRYFGTSIDEAFAAHLPCPADFDHNGFVNALDYDAFAELFETGDRGADFDGNGFVNALDYDAFAEHFEAGC